MNRRVYAWCLFDAPWIALLRCLAWPMDRLRVAQIRFIFPPDEPSASSPLCGGSDA